MQTHTCSSVAGHMTQATTSSQSDEPWTSTGRRFATMLLRHHHPPQKKSTAIIGLRSTTGTSRIHFFKLYQGSNQLLPFLPPPTILHIHDGASRGPLCDRVFSHYDPFFQGNITNTEENNMNLQRHAPRLQNAGVSLLWEMAMQEGHQKQKFHASLALLICCRVNVLLGGAKTLTGRRRKTDKKRSIIPINPSDTKLHNYIRVLATICEGVYHSQFKASFPRYYRMVMKRDFQSDSEDDDDDDEEEFSSFADLVYDRLQRQDEATEGNIIHRWPTELCGKAQVRTHMRSDTLLSKLQQCKHQQIIWNIRCPTSIHHQMASTKSTTIMFIYIHMYCVPWRRNNAPKVTIMLSKSTWEYKSHSFARNPFHEKGASHIETTPHAHWRLPWERKRALHSFDRVR